MLRPANPCAGFTWAGCAPSRWSRDSQTALDWWKGRLVVSSAVYDEADHRSGALFAFDSSFDGDGPRGNLDPPFSARRIMPDWWSCPAVRTSFAVDLENWCFSFLERDDTFSRVWFVVCSQSRSLPLSRFIFSKRWIAPWTICGFKRRTFDAASCPYCVYETRRRFLFPWNVFYWIIRVLLEWLLRVD